jgi:hypothetical protein
MFDPLKNVISSTSLGVVAAVNTVTLVIKTGEMEAAAMLKESAATHQISGNELKSLIEGTYEPPNPNAEPTPVTEPTATV